MIQEGHRVLIFSQTRKMLDLIQVSLNFVSFSKFLLNIVDSMGMLEFLLLFNYYFIVFAKMDILLHAFVYILGHFSLSRYLFYIY